MFFDDAEIAQTVVQLVLPLPEPADPQHGRGKQHEVAKVDLQMPRLWWAHAALPWG